MKSATTRRFVLTLLWCSTVILGLWLAKRQLATHGWDSEGAEYLFKVWTVPIRAAVVVWLIRAFNVFLNEKLADEHDEE